MTGLFSRGPAWLFCPGDRPDRFEKAAAAADVVILDLEDAVAPTSKPAARTAVAASHLDPERTIVRVNPRVTGEREPDAGAVRDAGYRYVMVPKVEGPDDVMGLDGLEVIALCETPRGVVSAGSIAELPGVIALTWGAEDLTAAMGGSSSRKAGGGLRDVARHARSHVLLHAVAAGRAAVETVYLNIDDEEGLEATAHDASASGFAAMMCIHPKQVAVIREAFAPSPKRDAWARAVLHAAQDAGAAVFTFDGQMVDEPVLRQARNILREER